MPRRRRNIVGAGLVLLAAGSAAAADPSAAPPAQARVAIRSLGMVATAEAACPEYKVDTVAADALALRLQANEAAELYADFTRSTAAQYARMVVESRPGFCRLAWTVLGESGSAAHILEKR